MAGIASKGAALKYGSTTVGDIYNLKGPSLKADTVDVTSHSSTGGWREFIPTLIDGGDITFDLNMWYSNEGVQAQIGVVNSWTITYSDGSSFAFSGILNKFEPTSNVDGKLEAACGLKITGKATFTLATSSSSSSSGS